MRLDILIIAALLVIIYISKELSAIQSQLLVTAIIGAVGLYIYLFILDLKDDQAEQEYYEELEKKNDATRTKDKD